MKIEVLISFAGRYTAAIGDVLDVPDEVAADLIEAGYAKLKEKSEKRENKRSNNKRTS